MTIKALSQCTKLFVPKFYVAISVTRDNEPGSSGKKVESCALLILNAVAGDTHFRYKTDQTTGAELRIFSTVIFTIGLPVSYDHFRTVPSAMPDAKCVPSGLHATDSTRDFCFSKLLTNSIESSEMSKMQIVPSSQAAASNVPVLFTSIPQTAPARDSSIRCLRKLLVYAHDLGCE